MEMDYGKQDQDIINQKIYHLHVVQYISYMQLKKGEKNELHK